MGPRRPRAASKRWTLSFNGAVQMGSSDVDRPEDIESAANLFPLLRAAGRTAHLEIADARPPHLARGRQRVDHGAAFEGLQPLHHARIEQEP